MRGFCLVLAIAVLPTFSAAAQTPILAPEPAGLAGTYRLSYQPDSTQPVFCGYQPARVGAAAQRGQDHHASLSVFPVGRHALMASADYFASRGPAAPGRAVFADLTYR